ncbi:ATP-binding cassette domain-containing protein [Streptantibioticus cattleyicolor]|uniref:ABC transporter ATP-binding protein, AmfA n=1 Tax=Streptantibioticus cattleyicolor (strain ATCC 35852 / DSM 46488 / JCM 4925 / NBRC 14057 / NRRL 8057) TaxID=1003195 RepID=G8WZ37_STREN|nr:ABC transporter ATP-binding protein, AmfA [Streptantibioticus cattleyicolor NRRL 8057 = DSM 46488]
MDGGRFAGVREGWGFFRRRRGVVGRLAAWSVLEAGQTLLAGYAPARALDAGFLAHRPLTGLGWLGVAAVAVPAGAYGTGRVYRNVAALAEPLRDALVRRVVARGVRRAEAAAVSRLTHQVEIARDTFAGLVLLARSFVFTAVGALTGLLLLDPLLLVVVVPPLAVGLALFAATLRPMARRQEAFLTADEAIAAELALVSGGLRDVTAAGAEDRVAAGAGALIDAEYRAARRLAWWSVVRAAAPVAGGRLPVVLLLALAPWLTGRGVTPGALVGALTYLTQSLQPALQTLTHGLGTGGSRLTVVLRRLLRGADASPRPAPVPPGGPPPGAPAVELRGVTFGYGPGAEPVVRGLDLTVPHGGHLAVVGPSGVGKSTVTALIAGVLVADAGRIRVCGAPPGPPAHRVLIPQEAYVFTGTVRDNLGYLREDPVADDEARAAAEAVGAARLIDRLGGLDAPLDPAALAAGERQLIALARAFLSPAPVVLLDEATCHLDPAAEARAERAFAARPGGTLIVVAHRIASARRAGRVLVMDGPHTDCGTHQELLDRSARYRDLVGAWDGRADAEAGAEEEAPEAATGTERVGRSHPAGPL